jgi:hypothetical protein
MESRRTSLITYVEGRDWELELLSHEDHAVQIDSL